MKKKFIIIDGHAIIHRAYHALPPLTVKDGTVVNAVFGFSSMLLKVLSEFKPDYIAVTFDVGGGTFRDEIYTEYKATRKKADQDLYDQIPLVYDVVKTFDIPIYEQAGFEADDVIGTLAKTIKTKHKDIQTIIVTGDQDMLQLVDDNVVDVYLLKRGISEFQLFNDKSVKEKFGFGPDKIVDYKALRGDSSDNIPGVRGIGEKTAKQLIEKIGGIKEIYKEIKAPNSKLQENFSNSVITKLTDGEDDARMSFKLATIHQDVSKLDFKLEECQAREFDNSKIEDFFKKFEFFSLIKRIPGSKQKLQVASPKKKTSKRKLKIIDDTNITDILDDIKKEKQFSCREVATDKDPINSELLGFVFVTYKNAYYIELKKLTAENKNKILELFSNKNNKLIGHDLKQLVKIIMYSSGQLPQSPEHKFHNSLFDIMVASYLINSSTRAHDLKSIVLRELGNDLPVGSDQATLFGVDPSIIAEELGYMLDIEKMYYKKLHDLELLKLFETMEMPLIPVLAKMELNGVSLDFELLQKLSEIAAETLEKITTNIYKEAGEEFNIASNVQLRDVLFEKMELPTKGIKKGKTGYSTAASELEKLHDIHPIIALIEQFRETEKLRNTYIDVLPNLVNKKTKRIHTSFNQTVAATGRLSSSDPNIQNIPARTELGKKIRDAFISESGYVLIAADYSQVELRIVASLAKDKTMLEIFKKGEDIHTATAAAINDVDIENVTKEMRRAAKEVNFGVLYGMGAFGLSARTGIPQWQAKEFIEKYFDEFSGVKTYMDNILKEAQKTGYVETIFGRRRYIPELSSPNFQIKASGERMAINMPVQGTAADLMKLAMIEVQKWIEENYKEDEVKLLLQVHDELVLEVKKGLEESVSKKIKEIMKNVANLEVPIEVEAHFGKQWGKLK